MKKMRIILLVACMLTMVTASIHAESQTGSEDAELQRTQPTIVINGEEIEFANPPFIVEWTTLAPANELLTELGYTVEWDEPSQTVTASKQGKELVFTVDSHEAQIDGNMRLILKPARLVDGAPFIPLRAAAEADGRKVQWHSSAQMITIDDRAANQVIRIVIPVPESEITSQLEDEYAKLDEFLYSQTGIRTEWRFAPVESYQERLNLMIAAGDLPDIGYIPNPAVYPPDMLPAITWELSEFIKDYPNLHRLPQQSWDDLAFADGSIHGIPKVASPYDASFPVVRQDWLDKLGLLAPKTMDELYEVLKAFTEYDPDGNGKHDTLGLSGSTEGGGLGSLDWVEHVFNESPGRFTLNNGQIVDSVMQPGAREALLWLKRAYAEGLIDPEFPVSSRARATQLFDSQQSGMIAMTMQEAEKSYAQLQNNEEWAEIAPLVSLKRDGSSEAVTAARPAHNGMFFISKFATKEKLDAALAVMDALHAFEIEGAEDAEGIKLKALIQHTFGVKSVDELPISQLPEPTLQKFEGILQERSQIDMNRPVDASIYANLSNDLRAAMHELDREIHQMKIKVILGVESIEQWDGFIAQLATDQRYVQLIEAMKL